MSLSTLASRPLNPPLLFACPPAHQLPRATITIDPTYNTHHPAPSSRHGTRLHVSSLQVQSLPTSPPIHPPRHACLTVILLVRIRHCTPTLVHVDILLRPFIQPIHSRATPSPSRKHGTSLHVPSLPLPTLPTLTPSVSHAPPSEACACRRTVGKFFSGVWSTDPSCYGQT